MRLGVFLPISGRATGPDTLREAAQSAERQGFDAVWSADRVVTPWEIRTPYPYAENQEFILRVRSAEAKEAFEAFFTRNRAETRQ